MCPNNEGEKRNCYTVINYVSVDILSLTKQLQFTGWQSPIGLDMHSQWLVTLAGVKLSQIS